MRRRGHCVDSKYECDICIERFTSRAEQKDHEIDDHHYCHDCDRQFNNLKNIKQVRDYPVLWATFYSYRWD